MNNLDLSLGSFIFTRKKRKIKPLTLPRFYLTLNHFNRLRSKVLYFILQRMSFFSFTRTVRQCLECFELFGWSKKTNSDHKLFRKGIHFWYLETENNNLLFAQRYLRFWVQSIKLCFSFFVNCCSEIRCTFFSFVKCFSALLKFSQFILPIK